MKKIFAFAFALVTATTFAQSSNPTGDNHLLAVIELNDCCTEVKKVEDDFIIYKLYGSELISHFLDTMKEYYPRFEVLGSNPDFVGDESTNRIILFTDTNGNGGVAVVRITNFNDKDVLQIALNRI